MSREDIPTPAEWATNPDDRTRILVATEPHAYRSAIRLARQILRSHLEVRVLEPGKLETEEVARLDPALVISSRPKPATSNGRPGWVAFRHYDEASAKVRIGRRCRRLYEHWWVQRQQISGSESGLRLADKARWWSHKTRSAIHPDVRGTRRVRGFAEKGGQP